MCNKKYCSDLHTIKTISERQRQRRELNAQNVDQPKDSVNIETSIDDFEDDDDDDEDDDDEADTFKRNTFWQTDRSDYIRKIINRQNQMPHQNKRQSTIDIIRKQNNANKSYILWLDKKTNDNIYVANQLKSDPQICIDFCETFAAGQSHLERHLDKIKLNPSKLQIICRGHYENEHKNVLDLIILLKRNHLSRVPVAVFTHDKHRLVKYLESDASLIGLTEWKEHLYMTSDSKKIISRCKLNIENQNSKKTNTNVN